MKKSLAFMFLTVNSYLAYAKLDKINNDFCYTNKFMIGNYQSQPFFTWLI